MCVFEMRKCYVAEVISRTFAADQTHTVEQAPSPRLPGEFGCLNIRVKQHLQDIGQFDPDETESPPLPRDHDGALAWLQLHVDVVVEPVPSSTVFDIDLNVDLPFSLAKAGDLAIADPSRGDDPRCRLLAVVRVRSTAELAVYHEELDGDASFDLLAFDFAVNGAVFGMVTDLQTKWSFRWIEDKDTIRVVTVMSAQIARHLLSCLVRSCQGQQVVRLDKIMDVGCVVIEQE